MTTILVATDFSANAHWATDYARQLACELNVRLVILHAYPSPITNSPDRMTPIETGQYGEALQQLSQLRSQMLRSIGSPFDISVVARPGSPSDCLADEAATQKADLLIMGIVGDEPVKARQLGSLSFDMIPHTQVPMLLVPPGATYTKPQTMVLAIDLSQPIDALVIDTVGQFAHRLKASLDIVCMEDVPSDLQKNAAQQLRSLFRHQSHTFRFLSGYDVALTLDTYLSQHKADLLILLPKPHNWLRLWLLESDTQKVARLASVPVLAAI